MATNEIQDQIIEEFTELDDWMDRYQLLIDLGQEQEPLPEQYKNEQNLIDGCQSRVWHHLVPCRERCLDSQGNRGFAYSCPFWPKASRYTFG